MRVADSNFVGVCQSGAECRLRRLPKASLAAHVSRWLDDAGLGTAELDGRAVDGFLAARRGGGYGEFVTPKALALLLGYLRGLGVVPQLAPGVPRNRAEQLLDDCCSCC